MLIQSNQWLDFLISVTVITLNTSISVSPKAVLLLETWIELAFLIVSHILIRSQIVLVLLFKQTSTADTLMLICTQTWLRSPSALMINQIFISRLKCSQSDSTHILFAQPFLCLSRESSFSPVASFCSFLNLAPFGFLGSEHCLLMFWAAGWTVLAAQTSLEQHSPLPTECTFFVVCLQTEQLSELEDDSTQQA